MVRLVCFACCYLCLYLAFVVFLVCCGHLYLQNIGRKKKAERYDSIWWFYQFGHFTETSVVSLQSVIWAIIGVGGLILATAVLITLISSLQVEPQDLLRQLLISPGILVAILALVFTFATFINTLIVKNREELKEYADFTVFLKELIKSFELCESEPDSYVYIADFTPCIGSITLGLENPIYKAYQQALIKLSEGVCRTIIVCYDDEGIEEFHSRMQVSNIEMYNTHVGKMIGVFDSVNYTRGNGFTERKGTTDEVWRIREKGPWNLILTPNEGYQYIVLPEPNGKTNVLAVIKRKEAFYLNVLKRVFEDALAECITPNVEWGDSVLMLYFTPQDNVQSIKCFLSNKFNFDIADCNTDEVLSSENNEINICQNNSKSLVISIERKFLTNHKYLRITMKKNTGIESKPSKSVKIPTIISPVVK